MRSVDSPFKRVCKKQTDKASSLQRVLLHTPTYLLHSLLLLLLLLLMVLESPKSFVFDAYTSSLLAYSAEFASSQSWMMSIIDR